MYINIFEKQVVSVFHTFIFIVLVRMFAFPILRRMPVFSTINLPAGSKISNSPVSVKEFTIHNARHLVPFGSSIRIILPAAEPLFDSEYAPAYSMLKDVLDGSFV